MGRIEKQTGKTNAKGEKFHACERVLVKRLEQNINKKYPAIYTQIDTDSKARVFKSGYDILFAANGRVIFCECKHVSKMPYDAQSVLKLLSDFQKLTRLKILAARGNYLVIVFCGDGSRAAVYADKFPDILDIDVNALPDYIFLGLS